MSALASIRLYQASDASEMTAAVRESLADLFPWMPWAHANYAESDAAAWVRATLDAHQTGAMYDFAIVDSTGRYAGGCGINQINQANGLANLGYWVRSSAAGRGIAPAAVLELVPWVFQNTTLHRLEIVAAIDNHRSQRVAEKAGAQRDAVLKKRLRIDGQPSDAILYSILRPD
ncbi:MAG TPA: GNAT family protein [Polyangiaceae bacterium]|jgi:RimJ/RimL family protein N-acetyltransferase